MKINIINRHAPTFHEAVGISEERAIELSGQLDKMVEKHSNPPKFVQTCDVFNEIASFCNNIEEVIYCTINHSNWCAARGTFLCPPKSKK